MQFNVYRRAFAHVANKPFSMPTASTSVGAAPVWDPEVHLTNAGANVHNLELFHPYPIVDLPKDYPAFWTQIKQLFSSLACYPLYILYIFLHLLFVFS